MVRTTEKGQGLVESLLVILLISISAVTLLSFARYLSYSTNLTQQQLDANGLAVNKIETLRDFQVLNNEAGYTSYQEIASGNESKTISNTTYILTWTITANTNPTYKTFEMTVTWTDRKGKSQSIKLVTQIAGLDPGSAAAFM